MKKNCFSFIIKGIDSIGWLLFSFEGKKIVRRRGIKKIKVLHILIHICIQIVKTNKEPKYE